MVSGSEEKVIFPAPEKMSDEEQFDTPKPPEDDPRFSRWARLKTKKELQEALGGAATRGSRPRVPDVAEPHAAGVRLARPRSPSLALARPRSPTDRRGPQGKALNSVAA